jgi:membrane-associated phospholipid phosphatase
VFRLRAASAAVRDLFPPGLDPAYEAVTALGDPGVLVGLLAVCYRVGPRRETLQVVVYGFVGLAAVVGVKALFALPRPPASVALVAAEGYGFPSGHAVAAAVIYGGAALEFGRLRDRLRAAAAAALVLAVAFSRVALGVHYLGDVLAGLAVGVAVVWVVRAVASDVRRGFTLAAVVALRGVTARAGPFHDDSEAAGRPLRRE